MIRLLLTFLLTGCAIAGPLPGEQDHYKNFAELAAANVEGQDYVIKQRDMGSKILVMSFHGGLIEPGTTELNEEISRNDFDFYTFIGKKNAELDEASLTAADLHLTAVHFDEPKLMSMVADSDFCLGLHGFEGDKADFCVGGANKAERARLVQALSVAFPGLKSCELCCNPYNGVASKNPVNRCRQQGVQVEMSPRVRRQILSDESFKKAIGESFRSYLFSR